MITQNKIDPVEIEKLKENIKTSKQEEVRLSKEEKELQAERKEKYDELADKEIELKALKEAINNNIKKSNFVNRDLKSAAYLVATNSKELEELEYGLVVENAIDKRRTFYQSLKTRLVLLQKNLLEEQEYELKLIDADKAINSIQNVIETANFTHHAVALRGLKSEYENITRTLCEDEISGRPFQLKLSKKQTSNLDDALLKDDMVPYWMKQ